MPARRPHLALLAAILIAAGGCRSPLSPEGAGMPSGRSGLDHNPEALPGTLDGEVRRGPTSPIYDESVDNTVPYPGIHVQIRDAAGALVGDVVSAADGTFSILLPAGYYDLRPLWPDATLHRGLPPLGDVGASVYAGGSTSVVLVFRTSIF